VSPELYALNPLFGQLTAVQLTAHTRGVEMATFLRATADSVMPANSGAPASDVGLVPTFAGVGRATWESTIRPVMAAVQNQMPLNAFARFANPDAFRAAALGNDCVLSVGSLTAAARPLDALAVPATPLQATPMAAEPANTAALCLYTFPWRVGDAAARAKLDAELAGLVASGHVAAYTMVEDRPLAASDTVQCLQLALRVPAPGSASPATLGSSLLDASVPVWAAYL
jgi:hypothetical protein